MQLRPFCEDLNLLTFGSWGFIHGLDANYTSYQNPGKINFNSMNEYTLHEFCHAVTLGYWFPKQYSSAAIGNWIDAELKARRKYPRDRQTSRDNELRTLAAEVVILRSLDVVRNLSEWLDAIQRNSGIGGLHRMVRKRLESPEGLRLANTDADDAVRAVRQQAASVRRRFRAEMDNMIPIKWTKAG